VFQHYPPTVRFASIAGMLLRCRELAVWARTRTFSEGELSADSADSIVCLPAWTMALRIRELKQ
jgi:hypothetical protein